MKTERILKKKKEAPRKIMRTFIEVRRNQIILDPYSLALKEKIRILIQGKFKLRFGSATKNKFPKVVSHAFTTFLPG